MATEENFVVTFLVRKTTLFQAYSALQKHEIVTYTHQEVPGAGEFAEPVLRFEALVENAEDLEALSKSIYRMCHGYEEHDVHIWASPVRRLK